MTSSDGPGEPTRPLCSVVIPAHDEERIIGDRLEFLTRTLPAGRVEIVVVANGCTDSTADRARSVPGVRVVEIELPSKIAALNAGDAQTTIFPRIYLDADVRLSGRALLGLVEALDTGRAVVASPAVAFDVSRSSRAVRAFYSVFRSLPYVRDGLIGLGVYGLSARARERFGAFPDVVADDLFVQRLFEPGERVVTDDTFEVVAPADLRSLLAVRTRVARGNAALAGSSAALGLPDDSSAARTASVLVRSVLRRPRLLPAALVYVGVTVMARWRAGRAPAFATWERDDSSRTAGTARPVERGMQTT